MDGIQHSVFSTEKGIRMQDGQYWYKHGTDRAHLVCLCMQHEERTNLDKTECNAEEDKHQPACGVLRDKQ